MKLRPDIVELCRKTASKPDEFKLKITEAVPTNRHKPMLIDFGPVSEMFRPRSKTFNCEIAQPSGEGCPSMGSPIGKAAAYIIIVENM